MLASQKVERFEKLAFEITFTDGAKRAALERLNLPELHKKLQWLKSVLPSELNGNGAALLSGDQDLDEISKQALAFASDVVFCHNDALSGNILHNDAWDRVQIIDYEYGALCVGVAAVASESAGFGLTAACFARV